MASSKCLWGFLSINTLRACVDIYIRQLSSFRAPTFWFIDLTLSTCHIQYTFLSLSLFFHEKTDKTRKYWNDMIQKWPPTVIRRAKHADHKSNYEELGTINKISEKFVTKVTVTFYSNFGKFQYKPLAPKITLGPLRNRKTQRLTNTLFCPENRRVSKSCLCCLCQSSSRTWRRTHAERSEPRGRVTTSEEKMLQVLGLKFITERPGMKRVIHSHEKYSFLFNMAFFDSQWALQMLRQ